MLGIPDGAINLDDDPDFAVWPENWPALLAFLACGTQWAYGALGGVVGLRYEGVEAALRMSGIEVTPELFEDLRAMEGAALEVMRRDA